MISKGTRKKLLQRPPAFHAMKGRHNLLLYLCLLAIAFIVIIAAPAQAGSGSFSVPPDQPGLPAPDNDMTHECTSPARTGDFPTVLPDDGNPGASL